MQMTKRRKRKRHASDFDENNAATITKKQSLEMLKQSGTEKEAGRAILQGAQSHL
jgi:hypothetical protein